MTESGSGMLSPVIMGTAIQADLAAVGIRAKIETYEWNTFLGKIIPGMEGKAQIAELSFMTQDPDMHPFLALKTGAPVNSGYYSNKEVDALIDEGREVADPRSARRSTRRCRRSSSRTPLGLHRQLEAERGRCRCGEGLQPAAFLPDAVLYGHKE